MERSRLLIKKTAVRELEAIGDKKTRQRLVARIRALADQPRPAGCEKLSGREARYRVRQVAHRVVYSVSDAERLVEVVKVGHRRDIDKSGA